MDGRKKRVEKFALKNAENWRVKKNGSHQLHKQCMTPDTRRSTLNKKHVYETLKQPYIYSQKAIQ